VKLTVLLQWLAPILMLHTLPSFMGPLEDPTTQRCHSSQIFSCFDRSDIHLSRGEELLSLPTCLGGLNIVNPVEMLECQFKVSQTIIVLAKKMFVKQSEQFAKPQLQPIISNLCRENAKPLLPR